MPMLLPRNCSGFSISGRTTRFSNESSDRGCYNLDVGAADRRSCCRSPAICTKATSPAISALIPLNPARHCDHFDLQAVFPKNARLVSGPGGTIEPEMEVIAARILRSGGDVCLPTAGVLRFRQPRTQWGDKETVSAH